MFTFVKFIISAFAVSAIFAVVSIAWPMISSSPRPEFLEKLYQAVSPTQFGKNTSNVLGVNSSQNIQPINVGNLANQAITSISTIAETKAREIITRQAIIQLVNQIDKLNPTEKNQIKEMLCQPVATPSSE